MTESTRQITEQSRRIGVEFLIADLNVALTFLDVAKVTRSDQTRLRNHENARKAYDAVVRLLPRVSPSAEEQSTLQAKLAELKDRLLAAGCDLGPDTEISSGT